MSANPLTQARRLTPPSREATLRRDRSVHDFWEAHRELLAAAWTEWERQNPSLPSLDERLIAPALRAAVSRAWEDPSTDDAVQDLFQEVAPGVFQCALLDPEHLVAIRSYLDAVHGAGIPVRQPYGIVLNRHGMMLDPRSSGYLGSPGFQAFYRTLTERYMRPMSRLLFPEVAGFDTQSFGFSIHYKPNEDTSIRPHTDASATTFNINLNLPDEDFSGSVVDFFDPVERRTRPFVFAPGTAAIHRGDIAHQARPIEQGERQNLVLWLYGEQGRTPRRRGVAKPLTPIERWSVPSTTPDRFAPF